MTISTPCVKICVVDPVSNTCQGCGRTMEEIARWAGMTELQRLMIMAELPARRAASRTARLAAAGRLHRRRRAVAPRAND